MTREDVLAIDAYCQEHKVSCRQRFEEYAVWHIDIKEELTIWPALPVQGRCPLYLIFIVLMYWMKSAALFTSLPFSPAE